jgi:ribose/xylose/arabinose/galactoside ABC-type transport system permease subunit
MMDNSTESREMGKNLNKGIASKLLNIQELGLLIFIVAFGLFITVINPTFIKLENILNVLKSSSLKFIIGCGMTFVLVGAEIDLSVGSVYGFCGLATALALSFGVNVIVSIVIGIASGLLIGFITGMIVTNFKIPALVVTLGMLYAVGGLNLITTKGAIITGLPESFKVIGQGNIFGIPNLVVIALIIGVISHITLEYTRFGYDVRCVGGNRQAAIAAGINVKRFRILLFMITGLASSIAGILVTSRLSSGTPTIGQGFELFVISAVIIGGVSLYGGIGTIFGTFLGAVLISVIQNGMILMQVSPYTQSIIVGGIMILAVGVDQYRRNKMWKVR